MLCRLTSTSTLGRLRFLSTPASSRTALIKELRARTSAPMKKCVDALAEAGDDLEQAATILRKAGLAAAAKKSSRGASEGAIAVAHDATGAAVVELNSETDFVARNELFQALVGGIAQTALGLREPPLLVQQVSSAACVMELDTAAMGGTRMTSPQHDATTIAEAVGFAVSQLGENLVVRRASLLSTPEGGGVVSGYVHNTYSPGVGRTAAVVALRSSAADVEALASLGQKIAMHVVAATPRYLERETVPGAVVEAEREVLAEQARASGKPAHVVDKMVEGRLHKFFADACLLEQQYMIDDSAGSVAKVIAHPHTCTRTLSSASTTAAHSADHPPACYRPRALSSTLAPTAGLHLIFAPSPHRTALDGSPADPCDTMPRPHD